MSSYPPQRGIAILGVCGLTPVGLELARPPAAARRPPAARMGAHGAPMGAPSSPVVARRNFEKFTKISIAPFLGSKMGQKKN